MKHLLASWLLASAALMALGGLSGPRSASAEIEGNCTATIKGADIGSLSSSDPDQAIEVAGDEVVEVTFNSPAGITAYDIKLTAVDIGDGQTIASDSDVGGDTSFSDSVNVKDYAWAGGGLYRVSGDVTLGDGSLCTGAALINVDKEFYETAAGIIALGATGLGLGGIVAANFSAVREVGSRPKSVEEWVMNEVEKAPEPAPGQSATTGNQASSDDSGPWDPFEFELSMCLFWTMPALVLTGLMMVGMIPTSALAASSPGGSGGRRLKRVSWRPRISAVGLAGGILGGLGYVVLRQQMGDIFPDAADFLIAIGIGLVLGVVVPSLIRIVTVARTNRAIANAEERLAGRTVTSSQPSHASYAPPVAPIDASPEADDRGSDGGDSGGGDSGGDGGSGSDGGSGGGGDSGGGGSNG